MFDDIVQYSTQKRCHLVSVSSQSFVQRRQTLLACLCPGVWRRCVGRGPRLRDRVRGDQLGDDECDAAGEPLLPPRHPLSCQLRQVLVTTFRRIFAFLSNLIYCNIRFIQRVNKINSFFYTFCETK